MDVFDWIHIESSDEKEQAAKAWLLEFLQPAYVKIQTKAEARLRKTRPRCIYKEKEYDVSGMSRLGDVWIHEDGAPDHVFYSHRVDYSELKFI
jgi:hypothetical protein